ncbi:MAG TPA: vitamin B12-dependent ribonucleotide reductase [Acidimicrobiales bacterium]|nr:vitamin B12-dependent ribonucleotide reductase [Acidimicrobiales bacterium]
MAIASDQVAIGVRRWFTTEGVDPYDMVQWHSRDARLTDHRDGTVIFEQMGIEVPVSWSVNASNILAQKYFRGALGTPTREWSLKQVVDRIVDTITAWGERDGYFVDAAEARAFSDELKYVMISQRAAFNSPVWFNIGVANTPQVAAACFILAVDDTMDSILNWYVEEGKIFQRGSGSGVNLSNIRASMEQLGGGGTASGPVSFMRGADASAGTIKSGGKTRRAAKMVVLDIDHPDVEEFIWCKAIEERKARALRDAGFDMDLDGRDNFSIQYQNANNSVRVTDEFMRAVVDNSEWQLRARLDGRVIKSVPARNLFRQVAEAAWECADPGVQFDTTINRWHTAPNTGRITASNPCSEYFHLDNSSCNLASLNLLKYLHDDAEGVEGFDVDGFRATVAVVFTAQEILIGNAEYPTEKIAQTTREFRQIGLGYANLGALLMAVGLPYDSDRGRSYAAGITALMTGEAYGTSARVAARMGSFAGFATNREPMLQVLQMHRDAAAQLDLETTPTNLREAALRVWDDTCSLAREVGVRNAQATVAAPTGTISFVLNCDTTGIEPDLGLVKVKKLVGGGTMQIVNETVPRALRRLGYPPEHVEAIIEHVDAHGSVLGAPHLRADDVAVFACAIGDNAIHYMGHVKMLAALQPFFSGGQSKTINCPEETTIEEIESLLLEAWTRGVKCVALYRDNCKVAQPMSSKRSTANVVPAAANTVQAAAQVVERVASRPVRERMPRNRRSRTFEFRVADCKGFVTVGEYDDGRPGELFIRVSKQGSTLAGIMDAFAISVSHGLQYGVPLRAFVEAFVGMRFEPAGMTDDPDLRISTSIVDYLFRKLSLMYLDPLERGELNILSTDERVQPTLPGVEESVTETRQGMDMSPHRASPLPSPQPSPEPTVARRVDIRATDAPLCMVCGNQMVRAGSCYACTDCGATSGCS